MIPITKYKLFEKLEYKVNSKLLTNNYVKHNDMYTITLNIILIDNKNIEKGTKKEQTLNNLHKLVSH